MFKNPKNLVLATFIVAFAGIDAHAVSYSDAARTLVKAGLVTSNEVILNLNHYEAELDEASLALYKGKEGSRGVNALLKLNKLKAEMESDFDIRGDVSVALLNVSGGDALMKSVMADMNRLIQNVKYEVAQISKGQKRFDAANNHLANMKTVIAQVRSDIKKDMKAGR